MSVEIQRVVDGDTIEVISLDATISTGLSWPATVTEHPVEDGSLISDHVRLDSETVTVTGFVTNTPVTLLGVGADDSLARGAMDALVELRESKELVQIVTDVHSFADMMLTTLDAPRDATNPNALEFTALFTKVRKVSTAVIDFPEDDTARRAEPTSELGRQTPAESTDEAEAQASWLIRIYKGLGIVQ
jgi:hypothetical protein